MTTKQAKTVLHNPYKVLALTALSYVNLTDKELDVLILRHMRGHTQERTAEELDCTTNTIQNIEKVALMKCCAVWEKLRFVQEILNTAP